MTTEAQTKKFSGEFELTFLLGGDETAEAHVDFKLNGYAPMKLYVIYESSAQQWNPRYLRLDEPNEYDCPTCGTLHHDTFYGMGNCVKAAALMNELWEQFEERFIMEWLNALDKEKS